MPMKQARTKTASVSAAPKVKELSQKQEQDLLTVLKFRFEKHVLRHPSVKWSHVQERLEANRKAMWSLSEMEETGGEPDVIGYDKKTREYLFCDCSVESPKGRRSLCYDRDALDSRKEFKPEQNAVDMAANMGIELLTEEQYRFLQTLGTFDSKTSNWIKTPPEIRNLGGALFTDFRYGTVFVYHNGASSYYAARGFRGLLKV